MAEIREFGYSGGEAPFARFEMTAAPARTRRSSSVVASSCSAFSRLGRRSSKVRRASAVRAETESPRRARYTVSRRTPSAFATVVGVRARSSSSRASWAPWKAGIASGRRRLVLEAIQVLPKGTEPDASALPERDARQLARVHQPVEREPGDAEQTQRVLDGHQLHIFPWAAWRIHAHTVANCCERCDESAWWSP